MDVVYSSPPPPTYVISINCASIIPPVELRKFIPNYASITVEFAAVEIPGERTQALKPPGRRVLFMVTPP